MQHCHCSPVSASHCTCRAPPGPAAAGAAARPGGEGSRAGAGAKLRQGRRCVTPGVRPRGEPPGVIYTHLLKKSGGRGRERSTRLCRCPRFSLGVARPCLSLPLTHIDCVADSRQGSASLRWLSCALHASAVFGKNPPVSLPWARIGCVTPARLSLPLSHIDCVADSWQGLASLGWRRFAFHVSGRLVKQSWQGKYVFFSDQARSQQPATRNQRPVSSICNHFG